MAQAATSNYEPTVASAGRILDRVLVAVDFSMESHTAVGVALELQRVHGSVVRLFHAAESTGSDDWLGGIGSPAVAGDWVTESTARLRRFIDNVAPGAASKLEVSARVGEIVFALGLEIREWRPTLLIAALPVHSRILRSPAEHLVHDVEIPTMIIPKLG
jgi:nucleotide-binding universal stress UspA family protein